MRQGSWHWAVAAIFVCAWGGNQFTPLLVMYREEGWSALLVNALLGAYVLGLVPGLLFSGGLAARFGRRPVAVAGVVASLVASPLLAAGVFGIGWIAVGRLIAGFGVAVAMAVGTTWTTELAVRAGRGPAAGARRAALWLTLGFGFGFGAGVAGVLAQWGPVPMVLPYVVHALLAAAVLPAVVRVPETLPSGTPGRICPPRRPPGNSWYRPASTGSQSRSPRCCPARTRRGRGGLRPGPVERLPRSRTAAHRRDRGSARFSGTGSGYRGPRSGSRPGGAVRRGRRWAGRSTTRSPCAYVPWRPRPSRPPAGPSRW